MFLLLLDLLDVYHQAFSSSKVSYLIQKLKGLEAKGPFVQFDSS